MRRIIWTCWFQGRRNAPDLVKRCMASWERENPGWEVRCLDAQTVARFAPLHDHLDLSRQTITAASLSDLLRILLLHEFGGVWADATAFCNRPLDDWLPEAMPDGFFAFANAGADRPVASWFLAAAPGNALLSKWATRAARYWRGREKSDDYFWFHHQFGELCSIDGEARRAWIATPRISADGPHAIQFVGMDAPTATARDRIDWTTPVFKLTHRIDKAAWAPGRLAYDLLHEAQIEPEPPPAPTAPGVLPIASLRVSTENLGDHIQIICAQRLLERIGYAATSEIDRDNEIARPPAGGQTGILLNGWFKTNPSEWPPHPDLETIYLGFHARLFQAPSLVSEAALAHYRRHGPVGARDRYTENLLRSHGVEAFLSHCLSLTLPRRLPDPARQTETFVVSRDRRILDFLPASIRAAQFVSHYSGSSDFHANLDSAADLLTLYRDRARLIVTTMLHCALPAIAMGIPVVVFMPPNDGAQHMSDLERFSSLREIIRVFDPAEAALADWSGYTADVGPIKLRLIDLLADSCAQRWGPARPRPLGPLAPPSALPVPSQDDIVRAMKAPERFAELMESAAPDRLRWRNPASYMADWNDRAALAASLIPDGATIFEIGVGTGHFRALIEQRCTHIGADLEPLDARTLALDIDHDPLPDIGFDHAVMLGVVEYLHKPRGALAKLSGRAHTIVLSYCCARSASPQTIAARRERGWVSDMTEEELLGLLADAGFACSQRAQVSAAPDFEQFVFVFTSAPA